jgi:molybdate transport system substrate-binding protein
MEETMDNLVSHLARQEHGRGKPFRRKLLLLLAAKFTFIALLAQGVAANAADVKVLAGAAMRGAFGELLPQFERATGHKIAIEYGAGTAFRKQIEAGETFDLVIIDSAEVDELIKQGKIAGDTRADVVRATIGVAVREGAPKPDISTVDAFKNTLLAVSSFTYAPDALYGRQLSQAFDRLGIDEQLKAKSKPNALARVAPALAAGEVELAIAGIPTLLSTKGLQIVGPLPGELQSWLVNTAGVSAAAKEPDAAKALVKYLATPEAAAVIKAKGMEPLGR